MLNRRTGVLLSTSLPYGVKAMTQRKENSETQRYSDIILEKRRDTTTPIWRANKEREGINKPDERQE